MKRKKYLIIGFGLILIITIITARIAVPMYKNHQKQIKIKNCINDYEFKESNFSEDEKYVFFYLLGGQMVNCNIPTEAEKYLKKAISLNPNDNHRCCNNKTLKKLGIEYFATLELGVLYYQWAMNIFEQEHNSLTKKQLLLLSFEYIQKSNDSEPTSRAEFYAEKVLEEIKKISKPKSKEGPKIEIISPKACDSIDTYFTNLDLKAKDDDYIKSIEIMIESNTRGWPSQKEIIELPDFPQKELNIKHEISHYKSPDEDVENTIIIQATDYWDNTSSARISFLAKPYKF